MWVLAQSTCDGILLLTVIATPYVGLHASSSAILVQSIVKIHFKQMRRQLPRWIKFPHGRSLSILRHQLTSSAASRAANWVKICSRGLRQTLARTLSRPLWGMPITTLSTPNSVLLSMTCFIAGIRISQPSSPNLFSLDHLRARNPSNL